MLIMYKISITKDIILWHPLQKAVLNPIPFEYGLDLVTSKKQIKKAEMTMCNFRDSVIKGIAAFC